MAKRHYLERTYGEPSLRNQGSYIEKKARVFLSNPNEISRRTFNHIKKRLRLIKQKNEAQKNLEDIRFMISRFDDPSRNLGLSDKEKEWLSESKKYYESVRELDDVYEIEDELDKPIPFISGLFWFLFMLLPKWIFKVLKFTLLKVLFPFVKYSVRFIIDVSKLLSLDLILKPKTNWIKFKFSKIRLYFIMKRLNAQ